MLWYAIAVYRDEYECCRRDRTELTEAGAVRACTQCHGQWATLASLVEMARVMTVPNEPRLEFERDARTPIACPSCSNAMGTWKYHQIELDRCAQHGIWFDRDELEGVLRAVFEDDQHPPDELG
ncbi:hypothetical protein BH11MYX1_BH11MYX1_07140 [soil metagenome]